MSGYIPIRRSLFEHFLFKENRVFSRFEAWLDLIQMASFIEDHSELINGRLIKTGRGEKIASIRFLSKKWNWSMSKVNDYLDLLRSQDMVVVDKESGTNKIVLVNFEKHNDLSLENSKKNTKRYSKSLNGIDLHHNNGTPNDTHTDTDREHPGNSEGTNLNKDNKFKEGKVCPHTDNEILLFKNFEKFILDKAPNVARMKEPFKIQEYLNLKKRFTSDKLKDLVLKMHNYKPLLQKNNSAYLTFLNWSARDETNSEQSNGESVNEKLKLAVYGPKHN